MQLFKGFKIQDFPNNLNKRKPFKYSINLLPPFLNFWFRVFSMTRIQFRQMQLIMEFKLELSFLKLLNEYTLVIEHDVRGCCLWFPATFSHPQQPPAIPQLPSATLSYLQLPPATPAIPHLTPATPQLPGRSQAPSGPAPSAQACGPSHTPAEGGEG